MDGRVGLIHLFTFPQEWERGKIYLPFPRWENMMSLSCVFPDMGEKISWVFPEMRGHGRGNDVATALRLLLVEDVGLLG
jgi:hypothetical protein